MAKIGAWSFLAGLLIAVILGLLTNVVSITILTILVVLGLIIGFLNITEEEVHGFLMASIALLLVGSAANISVLPLIGNMLSSILNNIVLFVAPAALVVAVKEIFMIAQR